MAGKGGSWALVGKQLLLVLLNEQDVPQNCHLRNYVCNHGLILLSAWVREVALFQWSVEKKKGERLMVGQILEFGIIKNAQP